MYRASERQLNIQGFGHPFEGQLDPTNRWVRLARLIPWGEVEELYAGSFPQSGRGAPALNVRVAVGALIIQKRQRLTDIELVENIRENPYLQFFIGFGSYRPERPFDPSLMVHFRKRLDALMPRINELTALSGIRLFERESENSRNNAHPPDDPPANRECRPEPAQGTLPGMEAPDVRDIVVRREPASSRKTAENRKPSPPPEPGANRGKLLLDATCAPADITFPTDLKIVNAAREKSEEIIDLLHAPLTGIVPKPRTYRREARKAFLRAARAKKQSFADIRKATRKQLGFLKRNLNHIETLSGEVPLTILLRREYKDLLVIHEVYRQQSQMIRENARRIDDRIVNIAQPHVRPIVRGKAGTPVEFGAKISISVVDGFTFVDAIKWDNFPEAALLEDQVERYRERFGVYPASVHADKIYRNQANRRYCKERGIRLSGTPLGRPSSDPAVTKAVAEQTRQDERDRNPVEGKFGEAKRRYNLNRVACRLPKTSECAIALTFLVMNLERLLRILPDFLFVLFFCLSGRPFKRLHRPLAGWSESLAV